MKKMLVAGALALALTATSHQEASAWCKFTFGIGFNCSYETTGCCYNWCFSCTPNPPPACNYGCPTVAGWPGYCGMPSPAYGYAAPAAGQAAPAAPAMANQAAGQAQQVGYYFYGQAAAPSYWYGH
jgi:hypothetical protein